jgi:hypothetical protein
VQRPVEQQELHAHPAAVQEAVQHAERALALYERKGNLVAAARVRRLLAHLAAPR